MRNGKLYYSRGSTKKEPGASIAWNEISDYWVKLNTYKKGHTVIYNGKTYTAAKNNRGLNQEENPSKWRLVE